MILTHAGAAPRIDPTACVAASAVISGDVTVGPRSVVGHGAVIRAESGPVILGADCVVMEGAVLRGAVGAPLRLGDRVLVGPRAHLTGCEVGDEVFLATGCAVFNRAVIGAGAEVRINAVVHLRTALAPGATVPIGWVAVGDPARLFPPEAHEEIWRVQRDLDFPGVVFGAPRGADGDASLMSRAMPRYAAALARGLREERPAD